jgi:hypothetical protein
MWDKGERMDLVEEDVSIVASLLKLFFRELPSPIIPEPQRKDLVLSLTGMAIDPSLGLAPEFGATNRSDPIELASL